MWTIYSTVATVFLVAGASKAANPAPLGTLIRDVWRLREKPAKHAARGVGIAEMTVALGLLAGQTSRFAGFVAAGASSVFLAAGMVMNPRAPGMACGCFGSLTSKLRTGRTQLALAAGLLAASLALVIQSEPNARPVLAFTVTSAMSLGFLGATAWHKIRSLPEGLLHLPKASA